MDEALGKPRNGIHKVSEREEKGVRNKTLSKNEGERDD